MSRKNIGKYVELTQLGQGGMADVYIGTDPTLNRKVAIKLILPHLASNSDFEVRFQKEAKAIAGMRHRNIVQIYEYSIDAGTPFMVMEYLDGGTLDELLTKHKAKGRPMPLQEAANILTKIASGLDYAHQRGLIHRDIKPSNILFSEESEPIIADFGIVKLLGDSAGTTRTGGIVGSPRFLSPEQASQKEIDLRSDIYSLGIVLYQMVTGEVPFKGDMVNVIMQHLNQQPENPINFNATLPISAANVVMKALEKNPDDRYDSAGEMAGAFQKCLASENELQSVFSTQTTVSPLAQTVVELETPSFMQADALSQPKKATVLSKSINRKVMGGIIGLVVLAIATFMLINGRLAGPVDDDRSSVLPVDSGLAVADIEDDIEVDGTITYTYAGRVYSLIAQDGATPIDISEALDQLSPNAQDDLLNISPNGEWLVLETERFDPECSDWACLAVVAADMSSGDAIRLKNGAVLHGYSGISAISSSGDTVVYNSDEGPHENDLWAISKSGAESAWGMPLLLSADSTNSFNYAPAISEDGSKVIFSCGPEPYSAEGTEICQVNADGTDFQVILTPADSPTGFSRIGALHQPDYGPNGDIIFEADWGGEQIWRLASGATEPVLITNSFNNDNSPCVLPDGRIVSLWLGRQGGGGVHELKVMDRDGESFFMAIPSLDIEDAGIGCAS